MYKGNNAKLDGNNTPPLAGKFCASLYDVIISTVAFINASRASDKFDESERSTAIFVNKPIIQCTSADVIISDKFADTGTQSVCTRIRLSPLLLVYNRAAWKQTVFTSVKLSS